MSMGRFFIFWFVVDHTCFVRWNTEEKRLSFAVHIILQKTAWQVSLPSSAHSAGQLQSIKINLFIASEAQIIAENLLRFHAESSEDLLCKSICGLLPNFLPQKLRIAQKNFQNIHIENPPKKAMGHPKSQKELNIGNAFRRTLEYIAPNRKKAACLQTAFNFYGILSNDYIIPSMPPP